MREIFLIPRSKVLIFLIIIIYVDQSSISPSILLCFEYCCKVEQVIIKGLFWMKYDKYDHHLLFDYNSIY